MRARELTLMGLLTLAAATGCTDAATTTDAGGTTAPKTADDGAVPTDTSAAAGDLEGTVYGEGVTLPDTTQVSAIYADPDAFDGKTVRVEGQVTAVCKKRGCWFELESDQEFQTLKFKVQDGVVVFPMSARGKHAVAEGIVRKSVLDLEQTREVLAHRAEEQGEKFDPASITEPMTMVRLEGVGAVVRDAK